MSRLRHLLLPNGLRVGYASQGSGSLVLFLHGFPDTHAGFLPSMGAVAAAGYHAVAPEPRGYLPTSLPEDGDYRIARLAEDVVHIADSIGAEHFTIVGHDPGAMTGYAVANLAPTRVQRLITASVPHTGHFLLNVRTRQAILSRYIAFFQLPRWPEHTIARDDFAYIQDLIHRWAPTWSIADAA